MTSLNEYNEMVRTGKSAMTALIAFIRSELCFPIRYTNLDSPTTIHSLQVLNDKIGSTQKNLR